MKYFKVPYISNSETLFDGKGVIIMNKYFIFMMIVYILTLTKLGICCSISTTLDSQTVGVGEEITLTVTVSASDCPGREEVSDLFILQITGTGAITEGIVSVKSAGEDLSECSACIFGGCTSCFLAGSFSQTFTLTGLNPGPTEFRVRLADGLCVGGSTACGFATDETFTIFDEQIVTLTITDTDTTPIPEPTPSATSDCEIILDGIENFISCNVTNPQNIGTRGCPAGTINISVNDINKVFAEPSTLDFPDTQSGEKFMNFNYKSTDIIGKTNVDFLFNSFDEETSMFTFSKTVSKPIEVFCPVSVPSCISDTDAIGLSLDGPGSGRKTISLDCTDSCPSGTLEIRGSCDSNQDIATCQVFEGFPKTVDIEFTPVSEGQTTAIVDIQCVEPLTEEQGITSELEITAIGTHVFRVTVAEDGVPAAGCFTSMSLSRLFEGGDCENIKIRCEDCSQNELQNISSLVTCDVDDPSIASCTPILFPGAPLNPEVRICPLSAGSTSIKVDWSCGPNRAFGGTEITAKGEININATIDEEIIIPDPKLFTFDCGEALPELPFFGMEMLTMGLGESKDCTLTLTTLEPGTTVNVSTKFRKGIRALIKVEPTHGVTDAKGEIEITITALRRGINWTAWAVPNDEGEFEFSKQAYDTGLAWGMFVQVK